MENKRELPHSDVSEVIIRCCFEVMVGKIKPWFDIEVNEWIFSHPNYPAEYGGESAEEVIKNYPKYLSEFIQQRLNGNLNPLTENKTNGHGGK